jgi:hypothetical protein
MKIPRLIRRKPAFKRRSSPPPAARKLLIASLASGLALLAMLAVVFLPRALYHEQFPPLPQITFELNTTTGSPRVVVSAITLVRPLSEYNATYSRDGMMVGSIHPLNGTGSGALVFVDADADDNLTVGDEFQVAYNGDEVLRVWFLPENAIVGHWPLPP